MAKKKKSTIDMDKEYTTEGILIRDLTSGTLTREFRVKYPDEAKADDNKKNKVSRRSKSR